MFDDILGKPVEKVRYDGEKKAESTSVGGVDSPIGMDPNKKPAPVGIGGLKGKPVPTPPNILGGPKTPHQVDDDEPELELDLDFNDEECDDCCDDDCDCATGCFKDEDVWSSIA